METPRGGGGKKVQSLLRERNERTGKKKTDRYGSPPAKIDAPRPVLEGDAPANRNETLRLERFYAIRYVPYHLLRLRGRPYFGIHSLVCRLVEVDLGHRRLNCAQRIAREVYVDFVYGRDRQRIAFLDGDGVGWVSFDGGGVLT